jgi:hypothetical protein
LNAVKLDDCWRGPLQKATRITQALAALPEAERECAEQQTFLIDIEEGKTCNLHVAIETLTKGRSLSPVLLLPAAVEKSQQQVARRQRLRGSNAKERQGRSTNN